MNGFSGNRKLLRQRGGVLVLLLCLIGGGGLAAQEIQRLFTEDLPPLNYKHADYENNGILLGPAVHVVREIQEKVGSSVEIEMVPWARGIRLAQNNPGIGLFSTTETEERDKHFRWVGPLAVKQFVFIARKDRNLDISSVDQAKRLNSVGVVLEDVSEQDLTSRGFTNLDAVSDPTRNPLKLARKRMDLWYTSILSAKQICSQAGVDFDKEFEVVYVVKQADLSLAFHKDTSAEVVDRWQEAYEDLYEEGVVRQIYENTDLLELYPPEI